MSLSRRPGAAGGADADDDDDDDDDGAPALERPPRDIADVELTGLIDRRPAAMSPDAAGHATPSKQSRGGLHRGGRCARVCVFVQSIRVSDAVFDGPRRTDAS